MTKEEKIIDVSVVIPTHNRADLLERAIMSVINQTYPILEINVVSDGSEDNTDEIMKKLKKKYNNINYFSYHPGKGGNYARNYGIKNSKGQYIAFLDDDDEWHNNKIEEQIKIIKSNDKIGLVCTGINRVFVEQGTSNEYLPPAPYDCKKEILMKNCIGSTTTVIVKKKLFDKAGYFDEELPALQDYDMWIRLCQITKVGVVKFPCVEYYNYTNSGQISQNTNKYIEAEKKIAKKYNTLIKELSKSDQKKRKSYFDMLISKKGMRNGQKTIALKYAIKAFKDNPSKSSIICLFASLIPYKLSLSVQRKLKNKGIN